MANQEHVNILKQGGEVWNRWRKKHLDIELNLKEADLTGTNLSGANLGEFSQSVYLKGRYNGFEMYVGPDLTNANLSGADLHGASLRASNLKGADFTRAELIDADLSQAILDGASFDESTMRGTVLGDVDLRLVKGLATVVHRGPSIIGVDTIYRSRGLIPESFLRGTGIPESFITYARSLVTQPIDYYTCFISYSSRDKDFAERLNADLQNKGVRCWFASEDLKTGDKIRPRIDESIRLYDKLLLVLSQHSVTSQWVEQEVEMALEKERKGQCTVLFPIRLDKGVMDIEGGWPAYTRNIGDFTLWKRYDVYQKAFDRLLRDLKAEASKSEP